MGKGTISDPGPLDERNCEVAVVISADSDTHVIVWVAAIGLDCDSRVRLISIG